MMLAAAGMLESKSLASFGSMASTQRSEIPALRLASASSRIASRAREASLGRKPLDPPAAARPRIDKAVVQPVGASLPEFNFVRNHAIAPPLRRTGRFLAVAAFRIFERLLQDGAVLHSLALRRSPGGEPRTQRPRGEVRVGIGGADFLDPPFNAYLSLELGPHEHEARGAIRIQLAALAAAIVRIENKALALDPLKKDDARGRLSRRARGGERHGVRKRQSGAHRVFEPALELAQRIGIRLAFRETGAHVFLPKIRQIHALDCSA